MARKFNEEEERYINDAITERGKDLFSKLGFQKTSILDITKEVGIASGTFYKFFQSKEALYFTILKMEEKRIREQFADVDIAGEKHPKKAIKKVIGEMMEAAETNPFIRELYIGNNLQELLKRVPSEELEKNVETDTTFLSDFMEKWKKEGVVFQEKPEIMSGMLRSLFVMTLHQKEIGEDVYPKTMKRLIDLIVDGLVKKEG